MSFLMCNLITIVIEIGKAISCMASIFTATRTTWQDLLS